MSDPLQSAAELDRLGDELDRKCRWFEARAVYQEALAIREEHLGARHPDLIPGMRRIAKLLACARLDEPAVAEQLLTRALEIQESAGVLDDLASVLLDEDRAQEAEELLRRVLAIGETSTAFHKLGDCLYFYQDRYEQAADCYRKALAWSDNPMELARLLERLSSVFHLLSRSEDADQCRRDSATLARRLLLTDLTGTPGAFRELRQLVWDSIVFPQSAAAGSPKQQFAEFLRQHEQVRDFWQEFLPEQEKVFGSEHRMLVGTLVALATELDVCGQRGGAEACYVRALRITEQSLGPDHLELTPILERMGWHYGCQGQHDAWENCLRRELQIFETKDVHGDERSSCLWQLARMGDTHAMQDAGLDTLRIRHGTNSRVVAEVCYRFGSEDAYHGRLDKAEARFRQAVATAEACGSRGAESLVKAAARLAKLCAGQGRREEAELHYGRALEIAKTVPQFEEFSMAGLIEEYAAFVATFPGSM